MQNGLMIVTILNLKGINSNFYCMEIVRSDITITGLRLDSKLSKFKESGLNA